jgi:hypothetical protein
LELPAASANSEGRGATGDKKDKDQKTDAKSDTKPPAASAKKRSGAAQVGKQ